MLIDLHALTKKELSVILGLLEMTARTYALLESPSGEEVQENLNNISLVKEELKKR